MLYCVKRGDEREMSEVFTRKLHSSSKYTSRLGILIARNCQGWQVIDRKRHKETIVAAGLTEQQAEAEARRLVGITEE